MKRIRKILVLLIIGLIGCNSNIQNSHTKNIKKIDIRKAFSNPKRISLGKIAKEIKYIYLESSDECQIANIAKVSFDGIYKRIYIYDNLLTQILIFNQKGKYINKIKNLGEAPFEYKNIKSICFDYKANIIYILDSKQFKILKYDTDGNFISYFKTPKNINLFKIFINNGNIIAYIEKPFIIENNYYSFIEFDKMGNIIKRFYKWDKSCCSWDDTGPGAIFGHYNNFIQFKETSSDTVFKISNDCKITPLYQIVVNDSPIEKEIITKGNRMNWLKDHNEIYSFIETNNLFFFYGIHKLTRADICFFKDSNSGYVVLFDYDICDTGFYDDISGGMPFFPTGKINDSTLFQIIEPIKLQQVISSDFYDTVKIRNSVQHSKLMEFALKSNLETNPIIAIVKLK